MLDNNILDLRYFGSAVRGDSDLASDVDVLCVLKCSHVELPNFEHVLDSEFLAGRPVDVSFYGVQRIRQMWSSGHLFAWHIYSGSKKVCPQFDFIESLGRPSAYENAVGDILRLVEVVSDVRISCQQGMPSSMYEAGLLYVAARNIGIAASWASDGGLDFSRQAPFDLRFNGLDLSLRIPAAVYETLCRARHASMRGRAMPDIEYLDFIGICDSIYRWALGLPMVRG